MTPTWSSVHFHREPLYIDAMKADPGLADAAPEPSLADGRGLAHFAIVGFGLMFVAACVLWLRYGPGVFFDSLNALTGCF